MKQSIVEDILPDSIMKPVQKGWHARGKNAYIVHDILTKELLLSTKLSVIANYLNQQARHPQEYVSVRGLYEAADKRCGYTKGLHKMRYRISTCDLAKSHLVFQQHAYKAGVERAAIITEVMG